ncbi:hypothetical protein AMR72_00055 [Flavobacterium psychrophilum]|nr:hypothetical protein AMR72_00055 [Flavobacterium psychrophilum]AOE51049.1 hypothetical protein ALW18_00055 [Flavobacterium psychrophilum]
MDTVRENVRFAIFKGNYETILSRILISSSPRDTLTILFPLNSQDKTFLALFNSDASAEVIANSIQRLTDSESRFYLVEIYELKNLLFQLSVRYHFSACIIAECSAQEAGLLKKILKKLYPYDKVENNTTQRLYLNMLLQYLDEILDKTGVVLSRENELAKNFTEMLHKAINPEHQVRYYAERLFVSRRYLTKAVRASVGETPKMLIDRQLIAVAKIMLKRSDTVYSIAEELKFESPASFATFFKKHTGLTPSQYRTAHLNTK